ncbi:hypothetical protein U1Q18_026114, partial [Sarracenia purpurea var. burkii]
KKKETTPHVAEKEEEGHVDSEESGQAVSMGRTEGAQDYNQAIPNMERMATAVQSEAINVSSEDK